MELVDISCVGEIETSNGVSGDRFLAVSIDAFYLIFSNLWQYSWTGFVVLILSR